MKPQYTHVGDASETHAFLTNAEGYDIARLEPVAHWMDGKCEEGCKVTPGQWQDIINMVNAAPAMLAALQAIAARVAEDRATVEGLGYDYTSNAEEDCADIAMAAIEGCKPTTSDIAARLAYIRAEILAERISYGEIAELQSLAAYIDPADTLLLEWAGVPETV